MFKIEINNKKFSGFKNFTIDRSIDTFCGSFSFSVVPTKDFINACTEGNIINITYSGIQVMKGKIFTSNIIEEHNATKFSVSGMDCTADLISCIPVQQNTTFKNITFEKLATLLCKPFEHFVDYLTKEITLKSFTFEDGETVFDSLQRIATLNGLLLKTNAWGDVTIYDIDGSKTKNTIDFLKLGDNIKRLEISNSLENNYSEYHIQGQAANSGASWNSKNINMNEIIYNDSVTSYRPTKIKIDGAATKALLLKKGQWEKQLRNGRAKTYTILVQGVKQRSSNITIYGTAESKDNFATFRLWDIGRKVPLIAQNKVLDINTIFLISSLTMTVNENGTNTLITLVDTATYEVIT